MDELKPCPFCGGEAYYSFDGKYYWHVTCFDCGATVALPYTDYYYSEKMKASRDAVIKKWNKRVSNVKTGEWLSRGCGKWMCSECGTELVPPAIDYNYCPTCGAKMEYEYRNKT